MTREDFINTSEEEGGITFITFRTHKSSFSADTVSAGGRHGKSSRVFTLENFGREHLVLRSDVSTFAAQLWPILILALCKSPASLFSSSVFLLCEGSSAQRSTTRLAAGTDVQEASLGVCVCHAEQRDGLETQGQ